MPGDSPLSSDPEPIGSATTNGPPGGGTAGYGSSGDENAGNQAANEATTSDSPVQLWYEQQAPWLRIFVFGLLRNSELVHDVVQNVFRKATVHSHTIQPHSVRAWLTKVAHHEAMLLLRKQKVHSRALQQLQVIGSVESSPDPLQGLLQREAAEHIRAVLQQLPVEQRDVVERRIDQNQTFAEIAAELAVPLGTVLTRMRLAMAKLRAELKASEE